MSSLCRDVSVLPSICIVLTSQLEVKGLQEPFRAQLCCSSGLQCDIQGCSDIAAPDGDTPNQLQSALVDAPMSAWLVVFLHGLLPSLLLWSAGCVAQGEGEEAAVRCEDDGAGISLAGCSSLLFKVRSLAPLPKELRLCTWLVEFLRQV